MNHKRLTLPYVVLHSIERLKPGVWLNARSQVSWWLHHLPFFLSLMLCTCGSYYCWLLKNTQSALGERGGQTRKCKGFLLSVERSGFALARCNRATTWIITSAMPTSCLCGNLPSIYKRWEENIEARQNTDMNDESRWMPVTKRSAHADSRNWTRRRRNQD